MEAWLKPMLCQEVDVVPESDEWVIEGKLDGWRSVMHRLSSADVQVYGGRNGSNYSGKLPYIERALLDLLPSDSVLDGELVAGEWGDVQGVMTRGAGPHVPSKAIPALTFVVFDVLRLGSIDLRGETLMHRKQILAQLDWQSVAHVELAPYGEPSQAAHERMIELGLEGSVCKRKDSRYQSGVKSAAWVKIKQVSTMEATIIGFKDGTNSNAGMVGAFEIELETGERTRCKVPTDQMRAAVTENPELFRGRTIEIKHNGVQKSGKVRHPRFLRLRDDKDDLSPRERQVQAALMATATTPRTRERQVKAMTAPAKRRMRNYSAMGDAKLLKIRNELQFQGEAYSRALESGSGNPAADLTVVEGLIKERGLE